MIADKLSKKGKGAYPLTPAIAFLISAPCFILAMNSPWLIGLVLPGGGSQHPAAGPGLPDLPVADRPEPGLAGADHGGGPASGPGGHAVDGLGPVPATEQSARDRGRLLLFRLDERPAGARGSGRRA
jgi:hypothetical protein